MLFNWRNSRAKGELENRSTLTHFLRSSPRHPPIPPKSKTALDRAPPNSTHPPPKQVCLKKPALQKSFPTPVLPADPLVQLRNTDIITCRRLPPLLLLFLLSSSRHNFLSAITHHGFSNTTTIWHGEATDQEVRSQEASHHRGAHHQGELVQAC